MSVEVFDFDQGSDAWREHRMGIPTASRFKDILAKGEGKMRRTYLLQLAGEIVTGEPMKTYSNGDMERGKAMEAEARDFYAFMTDTTPTRIGFVRNGRKGSSPDSLVGENGILELKTAEPHILAEKIIKDEFPSEHLAQCAGNLWVTEREWIDIGIYWPKMPLFTKRLVRDGHTESYIRTLESEVARFTDELDATVEVIRSYGGYPA